MCFLWLYVLDLSFLKCSIWICPDLVLCTFYQLESNECVHYMFNKLHAWLNQCEIEMSVAINFTAGKSLLEAGAFYLAMVHELQYSVKYTGSACHAHDTVRCYDIEWLSRIEHMRTLNKAWMFIGLPRQTLTIFIEMTSVAHQLQHYYSYRVQLASRSCCQASARKSCLIHK